VVVGGVQNRDTGQHCVFILDWFQILWQWQWQWLGLVGFDDLILIWFGLSKVAKDRQGGYKTEAAET